MRACAAARPTRLGGGEVGTGVHPLLRIKGTHGPGPPVRECAARMRKCEYLAEIDTPILRTTYYSDEAINRPNHLNF